MQLEKLKAQIDGLEKENLEIEECEDKIGVWSLRFEKQVVEAARIKEQDKQEKE